MNPLGRIPPQNIEAEMSLLGAILLDKESMLKIVDQITPEEFYVRKHSDIFETMIELYGRSEPIDLLTLSNRLNEKKLLEQVGGHSYLAKLSNAVPTSAHIEEYASIVRKKGVHRKLLSAAEKITELGFKEEEESIEAVLDKAQQEIYAVSQQHLSGNFTSIQNVLSSAFERIDKLHREKGTLRGVPSGFRDLDKILAGFQKSDLIILAARPAVGKTSFALDLARNAAVKGKAPVAIFSLEMSKEQLVDRMLCAEAGVDLSKMRSGNLSDSPDSDDFPRIGRAMGVLSDAPIFIEDNPGNNVMQIRAKCRRLKSEHGLGLVIIDYLQLMTSHSKKASDNRVQEVAEMSRTLKLIARELEVPVIALSQLSRAVEQTKPAIPKLSHLRDSGAIEQDADIVMFLYRKAADRNYQLEDIPPDERNLGEVHIAKHRNGPTGVVKLFFDAPRTSFRDLDTQIVAGHPGISQPSGPLRPQVAPPMSPQRPPAAPGVPTF